MEMIANKKSHAVRCVSSSGVPDILIAFDRVSIAISPHECEIFLSSINEIHSIQTEMQIIRASRSKLLQPSCGWKEIYWAPKDRKYVFVYMNMQWEASETEVDKVLIGIAGLPGGCNFFK